MLLKARLKNGTAVKLLGGGRVILRELVFDDAPTLFEIPLRSRLLLAHGRSCDLNYQMACISRVRLALLESVLVQVC